MVEQQVVEDECQDHRLEQQRPSTTLLGRVKGRGDPGPRSPPPTRQQKARHTRPFEAQERTIIFILPCTTHVQIELVAKMATRGGDYHPPSLQCSFRVMHKLKFVSQQDACVELPILLYDEAFFGSQSCFAKQSSSIVMNVTAFSAPFGSTLLLKPLQNSCFVFVSFIFFCASVDGFVGR